MAIVVKGKKCLCKTSLSDWNPERVNGVWFYNRYQEFVKLFSAKIPEIDFEKCFGDGNGESKPFYKIKKIPIWFVGLKSI